MNWFQSEPSGCAAGQMFPAALNAVDVTVGQAALAQERAVHVLDGEVKPAQIAGVLIGERAFVRGIDHAELNPMTVGRGHAGQLKCAKGKRFVQPRDAGVNRQVGRGESGVEIEAVPGVRVAAAVLIARGEFMGAVELEAPLVLAGNVAAALAAIVKLDVIVDPSVVNQRPVKQPAVRTAVPLAARGVLGAGQQMIGRHRAQKFCGE